MNYCTLCGNRLCKKELKNEGEIPFCSECGEFRFPFFSVAVSMIVLSPGRDKMLLIKQYGKDDFILTAGYVNIGENAENAVRREIKEELSLSCKSVTYNRSEYFEKTNTLMLNFTAEVTSVSVLPNEEVDYYEWFSFEDAVKNIRKNSLAEKFVLKFLGKEGKNA